MRNQITAATRTSTPNLQQFKQWAKDTAPAAKAVLMARVFAQLERERVNAYILPLFASYKFTVDKESRCKQAGQPITDPERLYLSTDEPMVAAYFADCDKAHRAHGFTGPEGHCPALRAESLVIAAESALMRLAQPLFGVEPHMLSLEKRAEYLELLIGSCVKAAN